MFLRNALMLGYMVLTRADHLFIYTQLYNITSKYYFNIYFNSPDEA